MPKMLHLKKAVPRILRVRKSVPAPAPAVFADPAAARKWLESPEGKRAMVGLVTPDSSAKAMNDLVGKAVFFASEGVRVAGKVKRIENGQPVVGLAVPGRDGLLYVSDTELTVKASDLEVGQALMSERRIKCFEAGADVKLATDRKYTAVLAPDGDGKSPGRVVDYSDVVIEGYASTFVETTPRDRGGDYVMHGAFDDTLADFKKNPVILCNHDNTVEALAGSWDKVGITNTGLAVRGVISNAPGLRDVRFKLVEGHLKGLSIGGIWYYDNDGRGIREADLFEISLVAVPMNPDSLAYTRSLGVADCVKAFSKFWRSQKSLRTE